MKLQDLTPAQVRVLAEHAGMTHGTLRQVWIGRRGVTSEVAIKIEKGALRMGLDIRRESLNAGCASCNFAKACRKSLKAMEKEGASK